VLDYSSSARLQLGPEWLAELVLIRVLTGHQRREAAMKVERRAEHAVSDETCKAATGRTLTEWHEQIDERGGVGLGRRKIGDWLVGELEVDPWWSATITHEYELARGALEKDGKPKGYTICATKSVKADAAACYGAFASAAALDRWFGARHDVRMEEGGHWRNADGNQANVRKVTPGKMIRLICEDPGLTMPTPVEIKFTPSGARTTVMVTIERLQTRAEADGYRRAWGEALDRLKQTIE
jgi:uncharacterized protein YndB with AHSA1/START domain